MSSYDRFSFKGAGSRLRGAVHFVAVNDSACPTNLPPVTARLVPDAPPARARRAWSFQALARRVYHLYLDVLDATLKRRRA